jgi:sulfatase maturation enzyme AslB (radical SAM superfamily)
MINVRSAMLQGGKPSMCMQCYNDESLSIESKREVANKKWMFNYTPSVVPERIIKYVDIRLGNLCNLKCRMCWPNASNQWIAEYHLADTEFNAATYDQSKMSWPNDSNYLEVLKEVATDIQHIYLTGGEPTLAEKQYELYQYLIDTGLSKNISLSYNTNCTNVKQAMIDYWHHFKHVYVCLSIDAIGSLHRYIRHPAHWSQVEKNFLKYKELADKGLIWLSISPTLQIYSIFSLNKTLDYFKSAGINDHQISFNILNSPSFLDLRSLPLELKAMLTHRLAPYTIASEGITHMNSEDLFLRNWARFKQYTLRIDASRNENVLAEIPELAGYL